MPAPVMEAAGAAAATFGGWTPAIGLAIVRPRRDAAATRLLMGEPTTMLRWLSFNRLGTFIFTRRHGERVGEDELGNVYYRERKAKDWRLERRWVVYARDIEPDSSIVPPGWSGWLHRRLRFAPSEKPLPSPRWEREHIPNLSGTAEAYVPAGHVKRGGKRHHATGDYEAWTPGT